MTRFLFSLFMVSCVSVPIPPLPEPPPPVVVEPIKPPPPEPSAPTYPAVGWLPAYDLLIKSLVTDNMIAQPQSKMGKFCDAWIDLNRDERKQFYADLLYAIAYPESNYANLSMYIENSLGKDAVTGLPVVSEGLLQLSYQDVRGYPKCQFDAKKDLAALHDDLSGHDRGGFLSHHPERDTLNPYKNLSCGVAIVDKLLTSYPQVEFADMLGKYWSTARRASPAYQKVWQKLRERRSPCE
jgi:hypothetical protein